LTNSREKTKILKQYAEYIDVNVTK